MIKFLDHLNLVSLLNEAENVKIRNMIFTIIAVVICFLSSTVLIFYIFSQSQVDPIASAALSLVSGSFVSFIIMGLNGSLKEFSIKSPLFELTSILKERIQYVQDDLTESKKEIKEKIASLENKISVTTNTNVDANTNANQIANFNLGGVVTEVFKNATDLMSAKLSSLGVDVDDPRVGNKELPENVRKALDPYNQRVRKLEELMQKLSVNPLFDVEYFKKKAYYLLVNRKYSQAGELYDKIIQNEPEDVEALLRKGITLYHLGKHSESIQYYDRILEIDPKNVHALFRKGSALWYVNKDMDAADNYYDKVLEIDPNFVFALWTKACNQSWRGNKDEALKYLKKAIRVDKHYKKYAQQDAAFKSLRDDPEFISLIRDE